MVLLHGLSSARSTYVGVVEHLLDDAVERGWVQVVNVDLRGHGESSHASTIDAYDAASYADDVIAMLEHVDAGAALLCADPTAGAVFAADDAARFRVGNPQAEIVHLQHLEHEILAFARSPR